MASVRSWDRACRTTSAPFWPMTSTAGSTFRPSASQCRHTCAEQHRIAVADGLPGWRRAASISFCNPVACPANATWRLPSRCGAPRSWSCLRSIAVRPRSTAASATEPATVRRLQRGVLGRHPSRARTACPCRQRLSILASCIVASPARRCSRVATAWDQRPMQLHSTGRGLVEVRHRSPAGLRQLLFGISHIPCQ